MSDKPERDVKRLALHEVICRCPKCKGSTDRTVLCPVCAAIDDHIDSLPSARVVRGGGYAQHVHNCKTAGVRPDTPEIWAGGSSTGDPQ